VPGVSELPLLAIRALIGGTFVVVFALVSDMLKPRMFAGLFGAAPSVALASLIVTSLVKSPMTAEMSATGMVVGGVAMVVYCLMATLLVPRIGALWGSMVSWTGWGITAGGLYFGFLK
jgi:hypothetical protein